MDWVVIFCTSWDQNGLKQNLCQFVPKLCHHTSRQRELIEIDEIEDLSEIESIAVLNQSLIKINADVRQWWGKKAKVSTSSLLFDPFWQAAYESWTTFPDHIDSVPQGHEGDAEKKTKRASELRHKRGPGVDQHLRLDKSVVGQGVQAEQEVFGLVSCRMSVANNLILQVFARFEAASLLVDPIQVLHKNLVIELLVSPGLCWNHMVMNFKKYFCPTFQYQNIGKRCGNGGH